MWRAARWFAGVSQPLWRKSIRCQALATLARGNCRCIAPYKRYRTANISTTCKTNSIKAVSSDDGFLTVTWENRGVDSRFPFIYLRDNCLCAECYHHDSHMRLVEIMSAGVSIDIEPSAVEVGSESVSLTWPGGHCSVFTNHWLYDHRPGEESENRFRMPAVQTWTAAEFPAGATNVFWLDDMLRDEAVQYTVLDSYCKHGVALIKGCGTGSLPIEVHERLGLLQDTAFGSRWKVQLMAQPNNLAYSSKELDLHMDLSYMRNTPYALVLHCIRQAPTGGHTFLVDGFAVAAAMKVECPDLYDVLATVPVMFEHCGYDSSADRHYHYEYTQPTFTVGENGNVEKVAFGIQTRSSVTPVDAERTQQLYRALLHWTRLCKDKKFRYELLLQEGDMLISNNFRVAHGRGVVSDPRKEGRCLHGCYYTWDDMHSRMRYLHYKLKNSE